MQLGAGETVLKPLTGKDADRIAHLLNNKNIWDNLRDYIPFPYKKEDAISFIKTCATQDKPGTFGIWFKNDFCGVMGINLQRDVYRLTGEVGYWVGEPYWGKGIASQALKLITHYGFSELNLERIFASTFSQNKGSQKVLEKCDYKLEGIARHAVIKNNQILDEHRYAILKSEFQH